MEATSDKKAVAVGAVMLGLLLLAFVLAFSPRAVWHGGGRELRVSLDDATGLRIGSRVQLRGAWAGQVSDLSLLGERAVATIRFAKEADLRADARVWSRPRTPLGGRYIEVDPGKADAPLAAEALLAGEPKAPQPQDLAQALAPYASFDGNDLLPTIEASGEIFGPLMTRAKPLWGHAREMRSALGALDETRRRLASCATKLDKSLRLRREAPSLDPAFERLSERFSELSFAAGAASLPPGLGERFARLAQAGQALSERAARQEELVAHLEAALATLAAYDERLLRAILQEEGVKAASGMPPKARRRLLGPTDGK